MLFDVLVYIFAKGLNLYNCKVTDNNYTPSLYAPVPQEDSAAGRGGSPTMTTTTVASGSPMQRRDAPQEEAAVEPRRLEASVYRQPSSLTDSSGTQSIVEPNGNGVTYAQVVFPPDKHKREDGTTSPKRLAVPANVPLHHLSETDVRTQLGTLKSFNPAQSAAHDTDVIEEQPLPGYQETVAPTARPQSPETDF